MTSRLVWRRTSFHNMWPGLLNWRQGLCEKIFPCTKSNLAAGGLRSCECAATAATERSIFLQPNESFAPSTGLEYQRYLASSDVSSISPVAPLKNH